jgi:hypothetical protein
MCLRNAVMGEPIDFNSQASGRAIEIDDVRSDRVLAPKAQARQPRFPHSLPEHNLRQTHSAAQVACALECVVRGSHAPSTMLRMVPLPRFTGEEHYRFMTSLILVMLHATVGFSAYRR